MDISNDTHGNNFPHCAYGVKITEKQIVCGTDIFKSYGLEIKRTDGTTDLYEDIAFTYIKINELYTLITENDVDEAHIFDIVCDFVDTLHSI